MRVTKRRASLFGAVVAIGTVIAVSLSIGASATSTVNGFVNFDLAATPPQATGTTCPPAGTKCHNFAAEPAIRSNPAGRFFVSSENGLGGGTDAWRSLNGGRQYETVPCPNCGSAANDTGFAPGGGDTDLAVASAKNASGNYNVYVASLTLANVDVSTSTDNANTWTLNPVGALVAGDDREWIAADGAKKVCVSYHDLATFNIDVNCSTDAAATFTQVGDAIDTNHAYAIDANAIGNLTIDTSANSPYQHTVYQTFSSVDSASEQAVCTSIGPCNYRDVFMGVSTDGGKTFTDHLVHRGPAGTSYGHQFVNVSVDRAGNVYSIYSDDHNVYYSYSKDRGKTWSSAVKINSAPANTAIMPWSTAGTNGKIDVVYYGSDYFKAGQHPDNYPNTAEWKVYFAQNLSATSGGSFSQVAASLVNHKGGVCESGIGCTGNRDLYDDFGVAASPTTGLASITYSEDRFDPSAHDPNCTQADSYTPACDHTDIATQTTGRGIF